MIAQAERISAAPPVTVTDANRPPRTVLMISYAFPPEAYVGGRRTLKYCKYLGQHGWQSIVLTIKPRPTAFQDESLCGQLPADVVVVRTHDLDAAEWVERVSSWRRRLLRAGAASEPANNGPAEQGPAVRAGVFSRLKQLVARLLLDSPDSHVFWVPLAFLRGVRVLLTRNVDVIYSSSPPHSSHLAAFLLAKCFRKPHVVDFRDPWFVKGSTQPGGGSHGFLAGVQARTKRAIVENAARVVVVTPSEPADLMAEFPRLPQRQIAVITNGYDPDDFGEDPGAAPNPSHFTITHTGTIYGQTGQEFFRAIERLIEVYPDFRQMLRINLVGVVEPDERGPIQRLESAGVLRRHGTQPHHVTLQWARRSDVLLILSRGETVGASHLPAKVFEYLFVGLPVLAVAPPGTLTELLESSGLGVIAPPGDENRLAETILRLYRDVRSGTCRMRPDRSYISGFERKTLAARFAAVLDEATAR